MPEASLLVLMLYLNIGKGGVAAGTPIDQAVIPINEPLFIETDKDLTNRGRKTCINGEAFPFPIAGCAKTLELADDLPPGLSLPFPDTLDEGFPADLVPARAFGRKLSFDHVLGSNPGMIGARHPENIVT
jgi:hypothetical protein